MSSSIGNMIVRCTLNHEQKVKALEEMNIEHKTKEVKDGKHTKKV